MSCVERLASLIEEVSGNVIPQRELARLERRATEHAHAAGHGDLASYVRFLAVERSSPEWRRLLELITVNESYLFRAAKQFRALADDVIAELSVARRDSRSLKLWSAGCARGEEAVTLAIVCAESPYLVGWQWEVLATDVDEAALADARKAVYGQRAVAQVPPHLLPRYFTRCGESWQVRPALLEHVRYEKLNLVHEPFPATGDIFDVIFLRNVLIYFRENSQRRVAASVAGVLATDGYIFLGPSESLWKISDSLAPVDLGGCFAYRRPTPGAEQRSARPQPLSNSLQPSPLPPAVPAAAPPQVRASAADAPNAAPPPGVHAQVVTALAENRLDAATALLDQALAAASSDPVLRALEGIGHDAQGRRDQAVRSYRAALYLEPSLYQVRLLLARALFRLGWPDRARHEYGEVLVTLSGTGVKELPDAELLALPDASRAAALARDCLRELESGG